MSQYKEYVFFYKILGKFITFIGTAVFELLLISKLSVYYRSYTLVGFEFPTTVVMKISFFWDMYYAVLS